MTHAVRALKVGQTRIPGPELFWMSGWGQWHTIFFNVVLIQGEGRTVLVNTGAPEDVTPLDQAWARMLGEGARFERADEEKLLPQLQAIGVEPADVTHLIVTPFQLYSTAGIPLFPNAEICLSKRGWIHFHTTHAHPHDIRWASFTPEVLRYLVIDAWERVRLLDDEDSVAPGVRTWWAGTHHRASLAVEVDTTSGVVVVSDAFFHYENVEDGHILGINENMYEALATYERTRRVSDHILPLYDPKVFDRYPGGVVAGGVTGTDGTSLTR